MNRVKAHHRNESRSPTQFNGEITLTTRQHGDRHRPKAPDNGVGCRVLIVVRYSCPLGLRGGVLAMRHSSATRWLNRGISLESVRAMLGHSVADPKNLPLSARLIPQRGR